MKRIIFSTWAIPISNTIYLRRTRLGAGETNELRQLSNSLGCCKAEAKLAAETVEVLTVYLTEAVSFTNFKGSSHACGHLDLLILQKKKKKITCIPEPGHRPSERLSVVSSITKSAGSKIKYQRQMFWWQHLCTSTLPSYSKILTTTGCQSFHLDNPLRFF